MKTWLSFNVYRLKNSQIILEHMHKSEVKFSQLQYQTMNEFET